MPLRNVRYRAKRVSKTHYVRIAYSNTTGKIKEHKLLKYKKR